MRTQTDVDLSDLDLLDDASRHARCTSCQPISKELQPFIALCGRRAIQRRGPGHVTPPNACRDCVALWDEPCSRCGL